MIAIRIAQVSGLGHLAARDLRHEVSPPEVWFGVRDGHVVNASVQNPEILTTYGIHVTDSEAQVLRVFPRARRIARPYVTELVVRHAHGLLVFYEAVHVDHAQDGIVTAINAAPNEAHLNVRASCD